MIFDQNKQADTLRKQLLDMDTLNKNKLIYIEQLEQKVTNSSNLQKVSHSVESQTSIDETEPIKHSGILIRVENHVEHSYAQTEAQGEDVCTQTDAYMFASNETQTFLDVLTQTESQESMSNETQTDFSLNQNESPLDLVNVHQLSQANTVETQAVETQTIQNSFQNSFSQTDPEMSVQDRKATVCTQTERMEIHKESQESFSQTSLVGMSNESVQTEPKQSGTISTQTHRGGLVENEAQTDPISFVVNDARTECEVEPVKLNVENTFVTSSQQIDSLKTGKDLDECNDDQFKTRNEPAESLMEFIRLSDQDLNLKDFSNTDFHRSYQNEVRFNEFLRLGLYRDFLRK